MRWWDTGEVRRLREWWGKVPVAEIARRLGRTIPAVEQYARHRLGLGKPHRPTGHYEKAIRQGHARGLHDADIARQLEVCRETVAYHRRKLGLPAHGHDERARRKVAQGVKRQLKDWGADSLVHLRWQRHRVASLLRGWPAATTPRQCDVLDLLASGPRTKRQIQEHLGLIVDAHGAGSGGAQGETQKPWVCELIRSLRRLGLVVSLGRKAKPGGRGRSCCLYALAPGVRRGKVGARPGDDDD